MILAVFIIDLWRSIFKVYSSRKERIRPRSHRSIRFTVFAIRCTFCSPPQTRFRYFHATSLECCLWRRANRIAYSECPIVYTSMWTRPYTLILQCHLNKVVPEWKFPKWGLGGMINMISGTFGVSFVSLLVFYFGSYSS